MKISVSWMQDIVDRYNGGVKIIPTGGIEELTEKIGRQLGAVEEVVDLGKKYQGIVIARVVTCEKHPDADKLSVCTIDDSGNTPDVKRDDQGYVQVVCGAPNVRAGLLVAWLPPGSTVPSSYDKEPFVLEARDLRGVVSNGMLASAHELAIGDDHSGIVELDDNDAKPGDDFATVFGLNDYVIDVENKMFTHRPDCFGQLGVAREIAGISGQKFISPAWYLKPDPLTQDGMPLSFDIKNAAQELVPRFAAVSLSNITVKPSPFWLKTYLSRVGIRPINNVVDITNFVMMETAQPLHAYDANKLPAKSLETRLSKKGDKLKLLGGKELVFDDDVTILITSGDTPVGVGGVMGGADTEVDENTTSIILECATFDMYSIRRTAMRHGLFTDAVTRFNKGQSPRQNQAVLSKAVEMLKEFAGGQVASEIKDSASAAVTELATVSIAPDFINSRLGLTLSADDISTLLTNVEFSVEGGDPLIVQAPFWRTDIEIPEDIVEEVGRLYGYDKLPLSLPMRAIRPAKREPLLELKTTLRHILAKGGASEVLTYSFVHGNLLDKVGQERSSSFELSNALSPDLEYYRLSLIPSLLDKVRPNMKGGYEEFALFELGKTHNKVEKLNEEGVPKEFNMLALVYATDDKLNKTGAAYFDARRQLDVLADELGISLRYNVIEKDPDFPITRPYDHVRSAFVHDVATDTFIGIIGEFKTAVRRSLKLPVRTAGFELDLEALLSCAAPGRYKSLSKYPSVEQDITLKVKSDVHYQGLRDCLQAALDELADERLTAELMPLDIYQKDNTTHFSFRIKAAHHDKTLKAGEVNTLLDEIAEKAHVSFDAERL